MKNLSENLRHEPVILMIGIFWALACLIALKVLQVDQFLKWQRMMVALLPILPFGFLWYTLLSGTVIDEEPVTYFASRTALVSGRVSRARGWFYTYTEIQS